jgi:hypothetical protein
MKMLELDKARFWSNVKRTNYCWEWTGGKKTDGYGCFKHGKERGAHRIAYQLIYGKIPKNKSVCHSCDNPSCVNPTHLFVGSHFENMFDRQLKSKNRRIGRSSRYHGVSWRGDSKKWRAWIKFDKKMKSLGNYKNEKDAAIAYDKECYRLFNRKEMLNFPELI